MLWIVDADYSDTDHAHAIVHLLDSYASDPMGGHSTLSDFVKDNLVSELAKRNTVHVILAFDEETPVGMIVSIEGFSTFACKPLLNIHDVIVHPDHRGKGIAIAMFAYIEDKARQLSCCKLTLEVLSENKAAQGLYRKCGFGSYELNPETGHALFWQKKLE
ncbi:MAG TPA: GNAT family N-acetyltransferase [Phycisphaerales bacterium]|nr:GNAT family N-acetyltransferase [Phycisphaerales bacterium]|tara:strand:+ start:945 stop:1427 length:483 start_codon:yes stop_codon:yes gene_type:complete